MTSRELLSAVGLALDEVREHKLRSFLTVLGVIIGTGTIIGVGSIIAGLDGAVTGVFPTCGSNAAMLFSIPVRFVSRHPSVFQLKLITYQNARAIAERCPSVIHVSP